MIWNFIQNQVLGMKWLNELIGLGLSAMGLNVSGRFHGILANIISALLGTVTPFCSCSSIPLFIGFTSAGLPIGVTFSFLISSPMVDLGSLVLLMSIFGTKVAVIYVVVGLVIAVVGGTILAFMMAVTTLSLPSMIMLKKAVKPKLLGLFIGICAAGIILVGYFFNVIQSFIL